MYPDVPVHARRQCVAPITLMDKPPLVATLGQDSYETYSFYRVFGNKFQATVGGVDAKRQ
ncbi:hypothetical protein EYF80_040065 [Liparis tanakae]|uniref:Uncharacterized protein n=1 Tax=Liparis tanakae TaxID=230148 RepID=A0A4Z2G821_9TELE|nr:hypothetical protein EYF80_040065 [Liparis tanakae]